MTRQRISAGAVTRFFLVGKVVVKTVKQLSKNHVLKARAPKFVPISQLLYPIPVTYETIEPANFSNAKVYVATAVPAVAELGRRRVFLQ